MCAFFGIHGKKDSSRSNMLLAVSLAISVFAYFVYPVHAEHWLNISAESAGLSPVSSPELRYAAANMVNSTAIAIVSQGRYFGSISSAANLMSLGQKLEENNAYLVLTKGRVETIKDRMPDVLSGAFNSYINPSFGFPLLNINRVTIGIDYSDKGIDITGGMKVAPGIYTFIVKNEGIENGKTVISVRRKS